MARAKFIENHRKNFIKYFDFIAQRHNPFTVFNDFLAVTAISIANNLGALTNENVKNEREKRYLDTINKYDERERDCLTKMFAELVLELESYCGKENFHMTDVLGEMFHTLDLNDQWKGQFFTPQHLCDLVGQMLIAENDLVEKRVKENGYFTAKEPCCGAGAMIYGVVNAMRKAGYNPNKNILVYANDIDERCIFMTYIQCSLYGIPAVVQQANSLTDEILSDAWFTPLSVLYEWRWKRSF